MFVIVPRRVSRTTAEVFVGSFLSQARPPSLRLLLDERPVAVVERWAEIDGGRSEPIFWWSTQLAELDANRQYRLALSAGEQLLATTTVETLPGALPDNDRGAGVTRPFTIWLSSCYSQRQSPAGLGELVARVQGDPRARPHVKCLVGDQVYLDELSLFIYSALSEQRLRSRFNEQYARTWTHPDFSPLLSTNGTFFLPDDHELWNNYPDDPFGIPLRSAAFWRTWMQQGFEQRCMPLQAPRRVERFEIGDDLSIFIADTRTDRVPYSGRFMTEGKHRGLPEHAGNIDVLEDWLRSLRCPGILVTQQPIVAGSGTRADRKLPDYEQYWRRLLPGLHACSQDIVVLSGDSHHGMIATTMLGGANNAHRLVQVVSSPLALVSPVAASSPERSPRWFPPATPGATPSEIRYPLAVPTYVSAGVARTEEHAMTVSFWRRDRTSLGMRVQTWLARAASQQVGPIWETVLQRHPRPRSQPSRADELAGFEEEAPVP